MEFYSKKSLRNFDIPSCPAEDHICCCLELMFYLVCSEYSLVPCFYKAGEIKPIPMDIAYKCRHTGEFHECICRQYYYIVPVDFPPEFRLKVKLCKAKEHIFV